MAWECERCGYPVIWGQPAVLIQRKDKPDSLAHIYDCTFEHKKTWIYCGGEPRPEEIREA